MAGEIGGGMGGAGLGGMGFGGAMPWWLQAALSMQALTNPQAAAGLAAQSGQVPPPVPADGGGWAIQRGAPAAPTGAAPAPGAPQQQAALQALGALRPPQQAPMQMPPAVSPPGAGGFSPQALAILQQLMGGAGAPQQAVPSLGALIRG